MRKKRKKPKPIFDWNIATPAERMIAEAIGAASQCWEHPERAGVYDSDEALRIADELISALKINLWILQEE
jgi:hypothetical protein